MKFQSENVKKFEDMSETIKECLTVNGNTIKEEESHSAYYKCLPEGLTKDIVQDVSKYNSKFVTAAHVAVGELAADILNKDKKVDTVEASIGFFGRNDNIEITTNRTKQYKDHFAAKSDPSKTEEDIKVVKHLVMNTDINISSAKGISLKSVKAAMGEEFSNKFNK